MQVYTVTKSEGFVGQIPEVERRGWEMGVTRYPPTILSHNIDNILYVYAFKHFKNRLWEHSSTL